MALAFNHSYFPRAAPNYQQGKAALPGTVVVRKGQPGRENVKQFTCGQCELECTGNGLPLWMYNGQGLYIAHKMNNENALEQDNLNHNLNRSSWALVGQYGSVEHSWVDGREWTRDTESLAREWEGRRCVDLLSLHFLPNHTVTHHRRFHLQAASL